MTGPAVSTSTKSSSRSRAFCRVLVRLALRHFSMTFDNTRDRALWINNLDQKMHGSLTYLAAKSEFSMKAEIADKPFSRATAFGSWEIALRLSRWTLYLGSDASGSVESSFVSSSYPRERAFQAYRIGCITKHILTLALLPCSPVFRSARAW